MCVVIPQCYWFVFTVNQFNGSPKYAHHNGNGVAHTPPSTIMNSSPVIKQSPAVARSNSCEDITPLPQKVHYFSTCNI